MKTALALLACVAAPALAAPVSYTIDGNHTFPVFETDHLGFSTQRGRFNKTEGRIVLDLAARQGAVEVSIDAPEGDELPENDRRFSVLDVAPIPSGSNATQALANSVDLARHVEALGYERLWVAEHHNTLGIASSTPAVLIAHLAAATSTLQIGRAHV